MRTLSLLALASSLVFSQSKLPAPFHTPSVTNVPRVVPPEGHKLKVPEGFTAEEFASGFQKPRWMLQLPGGAVLVSDSVVKNDKGSGSVFVINADKSKKALLTGLDRPSGLALWKDYLYVAEVEAIKRYKIDVKALTVGPGETVVPLTGYTKAHWTRMIAFDKKGEKMYVSVGSGSNVDAGDPKDRAAVNVYTPEGKDAQVYASGLRNPVSIRINPVSQEIWATVQERDGLGDDLVPDFFTSVKQGSFYGWPYAYVGPNEEPRRKGEAPDLVKKTVVPDVLLPAHAAAMDFIFYTGKQFPAKYRNGAFIAYRGSSNRAKRVGYSVAFVPFKGGKPSGPPEDFLTGWMLSPDERDVWGRPVGVLQHADGSLLISEDANNRIWRIRYGK